MPLHSISPFDPVDDEEDIDAWLTKHMSPLAAKPACRCFDWRTAACDYAAIMILSTRFAVSSFVIVLGAPLFLYFVIAGWNLSLLFTGASDLADHYRSADPLYRLAFSEDTLAIFLIAVGLVTLMRLPRFITEIGDLLDRTGEV